MQSNSLLYLFTLTAGVGILVIFHFVSKALGMTTADAIIAELCLLAMMVIHLARGLRRTVKNGKIVGKRPASAKFILWVFLPISLSLIFWLFYPSDLTLPLTFLVIVFANAYYFLLSSTS